MNSTAGFKTEAAEYVIVFEQFAYSSLRKRGNYIIPLYISFWSSAGTPVVVDKMTLRS